MAVLLPCVAVALGEGTAGVAVPLDVGLAAEPVAVGEMVTTVRARGVAPLGPTTVVVCVRSGRAVGVPASGLGSPARCSTPGGSGRYGEDTDGPPSAELSSSATYPAAGTTRIRPILRTRRCRRPEASTNTGRVAEGWPGT